jgi:hypothetical protein
VGVVGSPHTARALAGRLERRATGAFDVRADGAAAEARTAILHRALSVLTGFAVLDGLRRDRRTASPPCVIR